MHIWKKPIFSSLIEPYVWQWLWVCLSLQSKVTIVWLPLLGVMAKNQTDFLASAQMACSQLQSWRALTQTWRGPGEQVPAPLRPLMAYHTPAHRATGTGWGVDVRAK